MRWTVVGEGAEFECGGCDRLLVANQPIAVIHPPSCRRALFRCVDCAKAMGYALDVTEVENERWRMAREKVTANAGPAATPGPSPAPYRHRVGGPLKASEIGDHFFNSRTAAGNDRD